MKDSLTYQHVMQILDLVRSAPEVDELRLRYGEFEIDLRKNGAARAPLHAPGPQSSPQAPAAVPAAPALASPAAVVPNAMPTDSAAGAGGWEVRSPMVGTCYQAPEPGAKPFVAVGDKVSEDTPLCIVEVMKLMNTVSAGKKGAVRAIHFTDGQAVEYGQLLITIDPEQ